MKKQIDMLAERQVSYETIRQAGRQPDWQAGGASVSRRAASECLEDSHWVDSLRTTGSMLQAARLLAPCTPFS